MSGEFEYPDEAGYPDGAGTLDEGTGAFGGEAEDAAADDAASDVDDFAAGDERDAEGD